MYELKREDIHFVLVGGGTELDLLREMARNLRIEEFVTFTGRVSDELLMEVLSTADVCVNPDVVN
ncbi:MAG: glycosyltransferase [Thermodesulfobacteriota bacterium]|nr:glycosyltransferase [Thermodesulfobacteriota bacterium]